PAKFGIAGAYRLAFDLPTHQGGVRELRADRGTHRLANSFDIQPKFRQQFRPFAMLNKAIGNAQADDLPRVDSGGVGRLKKGAAEAAFQGAFFDGDHERQILNGPEQRLLIQWLDEPGIDDAKPEAFLTQDFGRFDTGWEQAAVGDQHAIFAPFVDF